MTIQGAPKMCHQLSGMSTRKRNSFKWNQWLKVGHIVHSLMGLLRGPRAFLFLLVPCPLPSNLTLNPASSVGEQRVVSPPYTASAGTHPMDV